MSPRGRPLAVAAAGAVTLSLLAAGCEDRPDPEGRTTAPITRGIDARSYYEDYTSPATEDSSSKVGAMGANAPAGVAASAPQGRGVPIGPGTVPAPWQDNTFVDAGTSGPADPREDPLSTFALDVDTGSWNVARTLLRDGLLPPPASIRPEEWVNAQPADLPEPAGPDDAVGISGDSASAPAHTAGTQLVRVGVSTRRATAADRRPVDITLVVDRSGSMDIRERLGLVKSSLALLADSLRDDDIVSVVSFEDRARPLLEPTPVRDTDAILAAIDRLRPGGSTNLEAGLRLGYEQARSSYREGATNLVVLASDGVANVGETGPGSLVDEIQEQGARGIHLVTVGYGMGNYNDHLMEQLADLGDGFYSYVDDFAEAERLFRDELVTTLVPVAEDARAQVRFDPATVASYRLIGYDNRAIADQDFTDPGVDAGELGAGHHATALYEVRLADGVEPGTTIGRATVRWNPPEGGPTGQASTDLVAAGAGEPRGAFALQAVVADLAQLLKRTPFADRTAGLSALEERAGGLVEADVPGSREVLDTIRLARTASPGPHLPDVPPPIR